ncbi:hypothetical protein B224_1215 [Aeromonas media WS]|nr:hypothetical protein B224_1215 [Aeromonas media WS]
MPSGLTLSHVQSMAEGTNQLCQSQTPHRHNLLPCTSWRSCQQLMYTLSREEKIRILRNLNVSLA